MGEKAIDIALALIGAAVAISVLTLVYSAFLVARAAEFDGSRRGDKRIVLARLSLVPVLGGLGFSWIAERVLVPGHWGSAWANTWLLVAFQILLAITALYAILAAFLGT
jgi:hypothetical protein